MNKLLLQPVDLVVYYIVIYHNKNKNGCRQMQTDIIRELISKRNLAMFAVALVSTLVGSIISTANCFAAIGVSVSSNPATPSTVQSGKLTAVQHLLSVTADGVDAPGGYHVTMTTQSNSLNRVGGNGAIKSTINQLSSPSQLKVGEWGYAIPGKNGFDPKYVLAPDVRSKWARIPTSVGDVVLESAKPTDRGGINSGEVWFGAYAANGQLAGDYTTKVTYTITADMISDPVIESVEPNEYNLGNASIANEVVINGRYLGTADQVCVDLNRNGQCDSGSWWGSTLDEYGEIVGESTNAKITVNLPNDPSINGGTYDIIVRTSGSGGHTDTLENAFTYTSEPRLLSASPSKFNLSGDEIMSMVGGQNHSMILTKSGAVFTYGDNTYGQLGTGDTRSIDSPTSITTAFEGKVVQIAALGNHSLALTEDGRIYSWGQNNHGQVGNGRIGDGYDVLSPIDITNSLGLPAGTQVIEVYAAWESSFALTNDGRIFAWGANNQGQLATGDIGDKSLPTEVTFPFDGKMIKLATDSHVLALTDTGHLYSWGYNDHGQADAGQGGDTNILRPIEITDYMQLSDGVEIEAIGAASNASMVLLSDNTSWVWGQNVDGNLGTGGSREQQPLTHVTWLAGNDDITQFATGYYSAIALTESGRVYVWGRNSDGQLGLGHRRNVYTPAELTALRGQANRIYATGNSLFAVDDSGPSYSWGSGSTPEDVSGDVNYRQMTIWGQNLSNATGAYIDLDGDGTIDAGEECGEFTVINSTTLSCVIPVDLDGITPGYYDINVVVRGQVAPLKLAKYFEYYRDTRFVEDNNVIEINKLFFNLLAVSKLDHEIASSDESAQANKPDAGSDERGGDRLEAESNNNQEPSQASEVTDSPVGDAVSSEITPSINWDSVIKGVNRGQIVIAL